MRKKKKKKGELPDSTSMQRRLKNAPFTGFPNNQKGPQGKRENREKNINGGTSPFPKKEAKKK